MLEQHVTFLRVGFLLKRTILFMIVVEGDLEEFGVLNQILGRIIQIRATLGHGMK
ncbi:hypothetical protein ES703_116155 [subsurface metagenome]